MYLLLSSPVSFTGSSNFLDLCFCQNLFLTDDLEYSLTRFVSLTGSARPIPQRRRAAKKEECPRNLLCVSAPLRESLFMIKTPIPSSNERPNPGHRSETAPTRNQPATSLDKHLGVPTHYLCANAVLLESRSNASARAKTEYLSQLNRLMFMQPSPFAGGVRYCRAI